jgi:hypothetical protein
MALTLETIRTWAAANPSRDATLRVPQDLCPEHNNYVMDTYKFPSASGPWQLVKLDPAGLVSFALWIKDPLYRAGEGLLRRQLLNEGHVSMRADFESAAPSRRRRRMVELFENGHASAVVADVAAYWETWAAVLGCQFVRISSRAEERRISFIPEDMSRWSADRPTYYLDEGAETIFLPPTGGIESRGLMKYVADREYEGWTVVWPSAEGTKEELEKELLPLLGHITVSEKAKKAEIAAAIGRHRSLEALHKFCTAKCKI